MMCVFNRLEDLKLSEVITTNKTPLLQRYWKNLQKRDSYKKGILNYYTSKEHKVIKILIINIIKKKIITVKSIFLFTFIIFPEDFSNKFK